MKTETRELIIKQAVRRLLDDGMFDYWNKVERAPRWTCSECQFESNKYDASHHRDCSYAA